MKVFISHKSSDSAVALQISERLRIFHGIDSYLDVIDPLMGRPGEELADLIRSRMSTCTQLMAVVSPATKTSQWVPWEIGVATEKLFPLATYLNGVTEIPEFLQSWPYLRSMSDVDKYGAASRTSQTVTLRKRAERLEESASVRAGTSSFYSELRKSLGQ